MIRIQLIGNLTRDCLVNNVNGKTVLNFTVAINKKYKNSQGLDVNNTQYVDCSFWTERTAVAQYIKKGNQIYVEGEPTTDTYTKDGKTFAQLKLRVTNIQLLSSNNQNANQNKIEGEYGSGVPF